VFRIRSRRKILSLGARERKKEEKESCPQQPSSTKKKGKKAVGFTIFGRKGETGDKKKVVAVLSTPRRENQNMKKKAPRLPRREGSRFALQAGGKKEIFLPRNTHIGPGRKSVQNNPRRFSCMNHWPEDAGPVKIRKSGKQAP